MAGTSNRILCNTPTRIPFSFSYLHGQSSFPSSGSSWHPPLPRRCSSPPLVVPSASKRFSPRTGRSESRNKRSSTKTKEEEDDDGAKPVIGSGVDVASGTVVEPDDGFVLPELPGEKPDFWEGPQWDALGFFVQYMWAFGIGFALIACGIAVATYNEGATDFKETPAYKEAIQSQELLEQPESSNSDVFESNPTEDAPPLD